MEKILIKNFGIAVVMTVIIGIFLGTNLPLKEASLLGLLFGILSGLWVTAKTLDDFSKIRRK